MQKSQIKPSTEYAFRKKRLPGTPFEHVKILEYIRGNLGTHPSVDWARPRRSKLVRSTSRSSSVSSGKPFTPCKRRTSTAKLLDCAARWKSADLGVKRAGFLRLSIRAPPAYTRLIHAGKTASNPYHHSKSFLPATACKISSSSESRGSPMRRRSKKVS